MSSIQLLWADDEIEYLKPHLLFLEQKGYTVKTVTNGLDAVEAVKNNFFDLVFLDENMPGVSGLEALKQIKEYRADLPVVMITKSEEEHIMEDAIGSKIEDYLIKPVNPNQILLSIKRILDNKRLVKESVTKGYQQDFRNISMALFENPNFEEWKSLYKKLIYWETELEDSSDTGMEEVIHTQKIDANREFAKFIEKNYLGFLPYDSPTAPIMSHTLFRKVIMPLLELKKPVFFLLVDNLRFDQWRVLAPIINEHFRTESEDLYLSILPTTTQYCRNSLFSGLLPSDIEKRFPNKWSNDEDEGGKNLYEEDFINDLMGRLRKPDLKTSYNKILNADQGKSLVDNIHNLFENDLNVIVYNFVDSLSHARTDSKIVRELAEDEAAYRSLTKSWFEHSPLLDALKRIAEKDVTLVITTDHGSVRVQNPVKIVGDKNTTTNLRYKTGKNLSFNSKEAMFIKDPAKAFLPTQHFTSSFAIAKEHDFFVYPNNLNHYAKYYKDTFQHGGISIEEMLIPLIILNSK
jgi:CheY-like chemotaxis protein